VLLKNATKNHYTELYKELIVNVYKIPKSDYHLSALIKDIADAKAIPPQTTILTRAEDRAKAILPEEL
ncbi:8250_t:CDS:2, partial [Racocetra persica]